MRPKDLMAVLSKLLEAREPILIKGAPGIGKTDLVVQACEKAKMRLLIAHPVVDDPTDYKGLPFVVDGEAEFMPIGLLKELIAATEPTVFFMDDLGQAPPAVQAAAMQLILARKINGHMVSDMVTFVAATNRKEDRAGVTGVLEPVKSRFVTIIELEAHLDDWTAWAVDHDQPAELIGFINWRPELLHKFEATADITNSPCPRTVAHVGRLYKMDFPVSQRFEVMKGAAGEGFATEFEAFLRTFMKLPDPVKSLEHPDSVRLPDMDDLSIVYAFAVALASHVTKATLANFVKLLANFAPEQEVLAMSLAITRDKTLRRSKEYTGWIRGKQDLLL